MAEEPPENANSMEIITCQFATEVSKILSSSKLSRLLSEWRQCNLLLALLVDLFIETRAIRQRLYSFEIQKPSLKSSQSSWEMEIPPFPVFEVQNWCRLDLCS